MQGVADGILHCVVSDRSRGGSLSRENIADATELLRKQAVPGGAVRVVVLTGEAGTFCSGGDVKAFAESPNPAEYVHGLVESLHEFVDVMTRAPVPVVAAVEGWAAGAGLSLVSASDVAVGSASTQMTAAYAGIGYSPDGGLTWSLPRVVGLSRALDLILTNEAVDGARAYEMGLLTRLVPDDQVLATAWSIAVTLRDGSASALAAIKELVRSSHRDDLAAQLARETESVTQLAASPDGLEGVAAFAQRRSPQFA